MESNLLSPRIAHRASLPLLPHGVYTIPIKTSWVLSSRGVGILSDGSTAGTTSFTRKHQFNSASFGSDPPLSAPSFRSSMSSRRFNALHTILELGTSLSVRIHLSPCHARAQRVSSSADPSRTVPCESSARLFQCGSISHRAMRELSASLPVQIHLPSRHLGA